MSAPPIPAATEPPLTDSYARVVNVNPLTGLPALLGEVAATPDGLTMFGGAWREAPPRPLTWLLAQAPALNQPLRDLLADYVGPTELLVRLGSDPPRAESIAARPLTLTPAAALRFAHARLTTGQVSGDALLAALPPAALTAERARLAPGRNAHLVPATRGLPVCGGVASGRLARADGVATVAGAVGGPLRLALVDRIEAHHTVLLADPTCAGVLAVRGSPADHFALLAREKDLPYLLLPGHSLGEEGLGCPDRIVPYGELVTIDCVTGQLYQGEGVVDRDAADPGLVAVQALLAERVSPVPLRLNLDAVDDLPDGLPPDVAGIGLLRTEHLIRRGGLDGALRRYLGAADSPDGQAALAELAAFHVQELTRLLALVGGRPVTIRLLDYPLHELGGPLAGEVNPMLGLRGVRQGLRWPALYRMQIEAALRAAVAVQATGRQIADLELMVPLVNLPEEVALVRRWLTEARQTMPAADSLAVRLGAMIETPAAAGASGALAVACDFLSFGSNDLTQLLLGLSREDYPAMLPLYRQYGLFGDDPFQRLHPAVLDCLRAAASAARRARPSVGLGLCGLHAADPAALTLCREGLLDYLSVSRRQLLPVKLAAIQRATAPPA